MLELKKINAKVKDSDKQILNNLSLKINDGQIHAIMGPNGTGKTTIANVIMNHYNYELISGNILFDNKNINNLSTDERARLGIFLCNQAPTEIEGVSNSEFLRTALSSKTGRKVNLYTFIKDMEENMKSLGLDSSMMHRSLNVGFSGGEKKKNEILQLKILKPKFIILDELDSGLDVDSLKIVCRNINEYKNENSNCSILIITHHPKILEYIKPDVVHILDNGMIVKSGDLSLAYKIEEEGYKNE